MTAKLNLSSNPFRNRAFPWTVTALITVASIVALLIIAQKTFQANAQTQAAQRQVSQLRQETGVLSQRIKDIEVALTPEQKRELKYAHALVDRKRFSWSRLFSDLESSLPGGIRITRILIKEITIQGDRPVADLDLVVASKNPSTVTQMIQEMESGGTFHAELVTVNPQRGKGETGAEYELNVHYVPRAGFAIEPSTARPPVDTAGQGGTTR
jgi:Tfp pilus assembly protein PilN